MRAWIASGLLALLFSGSPAAAQDLEGLLERARSGRAEEIAQRAPQVRGWMVELVALRLKSGGGASRDAQRLRDKLVQAGAAGGLALLDFFDLSPDSPGLAAIKGGPPPLPDSKQATLLALEEASLALERLHSPALVPALIAGFQSALPPVRAATLALLPKLGAPELAIPFLEARYEQNGLERSLRAEALRGLLALDEPKRSARISRALASEPANLAEVALRYLITTEDPSKDAEVDTLARDPARAPALFDALYLYWRTLPKTLGAQELLTWLGWIGTETLPREQAPLLLVRLGRLPLPAKELEPRVRELAADLPAPIDRAAKILLANLGDKAVRRELLDQADLAIERAQEDAWTALQARAELLLDLNDPGAALDDLKRVLKLNQGASPFVRRGGFLAQARAYALQSKLDKAAEALEEARLPADERVKLRADPDFAELLAHPRHGEVLRR
jgi:hypothetical protein